RRAPVRTRVVHQHVERGLALGERVGERAGAGLRREIGGQRGGPPPPAPLRRAALALPALAPRPADAAPPRPRAPPHPRLPAPPRICEPHPARPAPPAPPLARHGEELRHAAHPAPPGVPASRAAGPCGTTAPVASCHARRTTNGRSMRNRNGTPIVSKPASC